MTDIENWLSRYEASYRKLNNPVLYWASISMLLVGLTAVLWSIPVPGEFERISPLLNWGSTFLMVAAIYYFIISLALAIGLLPFLLGLAALQLWLETSALPVNAIAIGLLAAGMAGIVLCRGGKLRAILEDLQLMMLGPAWTLSLVFRHFGIPV